MTQLFLDFDGRSPDQDHDPEPPPPRVPPDACVLVRSLEEQAQEGARERRLLVARTRGEGRELLRQVAVRGKSWVGFDVTAARRLAMQIASRRIGREGLTVVDAFDEQALIERAIDDVFRSGGHPRFRGLIDKVGFRDAVRNSVVAPRLGGVHVGTLAVASMDDSEKQSFIRAVLGRFEHLLDDRRSVDTARMLELATEELERGAAERPVAGPVYLMPGLTDRGLVGGFVRALQRGGATVLKTDAVVGLPVPKGVLWDVAPPEVPRNYLHAVERSPGRPGRIELFSAASVYDELRGVLRRAVHYGANWDEVEIITPDPASYGSALHALAGPLGIPVTFAVGLPVERTRPGRVVTTYFRWLESGFQESVVRSLIEAEDVKPPPPHDWIDGPRLARALRRLRIGWGRGRYLAAIQRGLDDLGELTPLRYENEDQFERRRKRLRQDLEALRALVRPLLDATPDLDDAGKPASVSPAAVATGVRRLLHHVTPGTEPDETALLRLVRQLDRIVATLDRVTDFSSAAAIVQGFLEIRVPAPRAEGIAPWTSAPGHLYLTDLQHGGLTGRPFTFIAGLDSGRFPGNALQDPLLLDAERWRLGRGQLPLASERAEESRFLFAQLFARLRGTVTLSYARWDPAQARGLTPAAELLQAFRLRQSDRTLDFQDLDEHLDVAESRIPGPQAPVDLDSDDVWFRALTTPDGRLRNGLEALRTAFPRLDRGLAVLDGLEAEAPTVHTGFLGQASPPFSHEDVGARAYSASGLGDLGACPRRYLLKYVLGAYPPDDPEFDPHRWLNALERGALLHSVFEETLREADRQKLAPDEDAFLALALATVDREGADALIRVPTPSLAVHQWEMEALRDDVRSFVEMIRGESPHWTALELRFGFDADHTMDAGGRAVRVRGAIDRVDLHDGRLRVVDYKTGSPRGYDRRSGIYDGGRRLQHVVYASVAEALLGTPVERMEYHFPSRRGENRIKAFDVEVLAHGGALIATLLDGVASGWFPATDAPKTDCRFCDYQEVCGVTSDRWGNFWTRFSDWTVRNLETTPELAILRRVRNWEDEEPVL